MLKYIIYCGMASIFGSIVGLISGFQLLPTVIYNAYSTMYHLPALITQFNWIFAVVASLLVMVCTMGATISACHYSLKEKPAFLMLPRAPKAGKRVLLERIKFIWSHMSFTQKGDYTKHHPI